MNLKKNDMVILTPVLKSNDLNGESLSLPPVAITGGVRNKIVNRNEKLGNQGLLPFKMKPQTILKRKNKTSQSLAYNSSVSYRP